MKKPTSLLFFCLSFTSLLSFGQVSFVLTNSICAGDSVQVVANSNGFPASSFYWSVNPAGVVITSPTSQATYITFTNSGVYAVSLAASAGNSTLYATQAITVQPTPQIIIISSSDATICSGQTATLIATGAASYSWLPTPGFVNAYGGTAFVSPGVTEIYTVVGSTSEGCVSSKTYTLHFGVFPNLVVVASNSAVCAGNSVTLSAFGAANYSWTSSNFLGTLYQSTLSGTPGTYSVIGSNGGSCSDSTYYVITTSPSLNLIINADRNIICKDGGDTLVPIALSAQGANYYSWEPYNANYMTYSVGPSTAVSPTISTCYTLTGSTPGCSAKVVSCINVGYCVELKENSLNKTVSIYPNPVISFLNIRTESMGSISFELMTVFGETLIRQELENGVMQVNQINLNELSPGFYIVKISRNRETLFTERILKE